ncbi:cysteine-tryptophan domain-containing zinc finger protein 3 [Silene latifolia]|uniref:cysteine-tryptophan domain-containing zinc finger protein 3 n=1 Tax=Silene latifolia TaxID=37657 RepID=UPI003D76BE47
MISMGSREGRNRMEQGFSSYSNRRDIVMDDDVDVELEEGEACSYQDDDPAIDPDVALSYIGEKLQNVLGHFQKDFEGLVSAESLGPKNGEYGTFLPAYRRSPIGSHPKSPPRVQNRHTSQPSSTLPAEGRNHNSSATANVSHFTKRGPASAHPASSTASDPIPQNERCVQIPKSQAIQEELVPKSENRDQRTLKVRIKVGSENLSVKKNTAIYSGLGLDGSPSPSFDDSLKESQGLSRRQEGDSVESPTQILHMMTSFPLFGGCVLSPLMDNLLKLSEKPKHLLDIPARPSSKVNQRLLYRVKDNQTVSGETTMTFVDKESLRLQNKGVNNDKQVGFDFPLRDSDVDVVSCEELISNALKLPLLSDSYGNKEDVCSDGAKSSAKRPNGVVKEGKVIDPNETVTDLKCSTEFKDLGKPNGVAQLKEMSSSRGRKKTKKDRVRDSAAAANVVVESGKDGTQELTGRKNSDTKSPARKIEPESFSLEKDMKKMKDKYSDFFGNLSDNEGETINSPDGLSKERLKTSELVEKATLTYENISREKTRSVQTPEDITPEAKNSSKSRREIVSQTPLSGASHNASVPENRRPTSDQAFIGGDSDVWVECDECKKWRLLPPGSKEDELPDTWLCSFQTWLPNMNHCGISEEECIKVVRARYNSLPEIPTRLDVHLDKLAAGTTALDASQPIVSNDGKLKKTSKSTFRDNSNGPSSSSKKKQQSTKVKSSAKSKDNQLMNAQKTRSNDMSLETNMRKTSKQLQPDCHSDGGNFKSPNIKGRRGFEQELPKASKRSKTQVSLSGDSNRATSLVQGNGVLDASFGNAVVAEAVGKNQTRNSEFVSFGNSKNETGGKSSKQELNAFPEDGNIVPKKRKGDSFKDPPNATPSSGKRMDGDEHLRSKRHKVSKSEGKEASTSKRNSKTDRKNRSTSQQITDNNESLQKDSSSAHVAATSSSSKVSLKVKYKFQEMKGSPVESVSSSPLRGSISDKLASGGKGIAGKESIEPGVDHKSLINMQDKSGEGVTHQNRDKNQTCQFNMEKNEIKLSESYVEMPDNMEVYEERKHDSKNRVRDNFESNVDKCAEVTTRAQELTAPERKGQQGNDEKIPPKNFDAEEPKPKAIKSVSIKEKSQCLPPSDGKKNETSNIVPSSQGNNTTALCTDVHPKEPHPGLSKNPASNGHRVKNKEVPSPHKRESSSQAASSAIKEAKSLKHLADRLKNADPRESTGLYFDAALKFLHGASLLESGKNESAKQGDIVQAMQIYSDTAKLCRFCAHEYEKSKDMATAALAYKCMEVAYLRVVYSSHSIASRDRSELQTVLQMVPPGESPSSSASDIDNLNNTSTGDKAAQARSVDSPQLVGNLVIAARNRPNFSRLLSFAQDVNSAMEASRKSHIAFGAASASMGHKDTVDGITSIKRALDFNFHDVEGLLRLVRLAKEATSRLSS